MNTLCLCPKETSLPDSCSKLCGIPGWKSRTALKGNNRNSDPTAVFDFQQSLQHSTPSDSTRPPKGNVLLISSLSKQDTAEFLFRHLFSFSSRVIIRFSGRQEELQWPSADRTLDSKKGQICCRPFLPRKVSEPVHTCTRNGTISVGSQRPVLGRVAAVLHVEMSFSLLEMFLLIWQLWHHSLRSQFSVSFLPPSIGNFMTYQMCQHV